LLRRAKQPHYTNALPPDKALQSFHLNDNFTIEIFAAEPFVNDPVSLTFDDKGNVFVVEMPNYPYQPKQVQKPVKFACWIDNDKRWPIDESEGLCRQPF
jgi:hypothetical protein